MSSPDDLKETVRLVEALDRRIIAVEADVRERTQLAAALQHGIAELGKLDVVVANAGIMPLGGEPKLQAWADVVDTNFLGVVNAVHAALPHLPDGASIIATGSAAAFMPGWPSSRSPVPTRAAPATATPSRHCRSSCTRSRATSRRE